MLASPNTKGTDTGQLTRVGRFFVFRLQRQRRKASPVRHSYYPIALDLEDKPCLVVGGGTLATEKVEGLLRAGARVTVVDPSPTAELAELAAHREIVVHRRPYRRSDLDGIYLVYGATDDRAANAVVAGHAREAGILVNAVDDIPNCDFFAVAIVRRGDLQIAISTNGLSPAFARWMREFLDRTLPPRLGDVLAALADVRQEVRARGLVPPYHRWRAAIDDEVHVRLAAGELGGMRDRVLSKVTDDGAGERPEGAAVTTAAGHA